MVHGQINVISLDLNVVDIRHESGSEGFSVWRSSNRMMHVESTAITGVDIVVVVFDGITGRAIRPAFEL